MLRAQGSDAGAAVGAGVELPAALVLCVSSPSTPLAVVVAWRASPPLLYGEGER
jgi:hypothetical protein